MIKCLGVIGVSQSVISRLLLDKWYSKYTKFIKLITHDQIIFVSYGDGVKSYNPLEELAIKYAKEVYAIGDVNMLDQLMWLLKQD